MAKRTTVFRLYVHLVLSFIQAHVKFGNSENYRIFEENIINMEQYEEVEDLATFFDLESKLQQERQKNERERQEKERERQESAEVDKKGPDEKPGP